MLGRYKPFAIEIDPFSDLEDDGHSTPRLRPSKAQSS